MRLRHLGPLLVITALVLTACCTGFPEPVVDEEQVKEIAWEELEPYTSSHDRANWQAVDVRLVEGREVAETFEREQPRCVHPTPQPNERSRPSDQYWYVEMVPKPATPLPTPEISPTAPPLIPEPFVRGAFFLIDLVDGHVVARYLYCVIY
jgi:hypothetical protein